MGKEIEQVDVDKIPPLPENKMETLPDEVRLYSAENEIYNFIVSTFEKYRLPESVSILLLKSIMLDLTTGQAKLLAMINTLGEK